MDPIELQHVGVKGMKWGVRRRRPSGGERRKNPVGLLSDAELKARINRIELENKYLQLTQPRWKKESRRLVDLLIKSQGDALVKSAVAKFGPLGKELVRGTPKIKKPADPPKVKPPTKSINTRPVMQNPRQPMHRMNVPPPPPRPAPPPPKHRPAPPPPPPKPRPTTNSYHYSIVNVPKMNGPKAYTPAGMEFINYKFGRKKRRR